LEDGDGTSVLVLLEGEDLIDGTGGWKSSARCGGEEEVIVED
jgi:hypothetical protein